MRKSGLLVLVIWLWQTPPAGAVVGVGDLVYDTANHIANQWTAAQATISAVETVAQTGFWLRDLASYDDTGVSQMAADLAELDAILQQSQQVLWDIQYLEFQLRTLFDIHSAPDSTYGLNERLWQIRRVRYEQLAQARHIQALQQSAVRTIQDIIVLFERILGFAGEKQALQNMNASMSKLMQLETQQGVQVAAFQQALLTKEQEEPLVQESIHLINQQLMSDWPTAQR